VKLLRELGIITISVSLGLGVGAIITAATGHSVPAVFRELVLGAFSDIFRFANTLMRATPVLFTSLSFLIAFRAGLFNIGAEGQLLMGGFFAAWAGFAFSLPPVIHVVVCLLFGAAVGGLWGFIPGWLRAYRGANEFVTTMMLSYVALYLTRWFVSPGGPFHGGRMAARTVRIDATAELPRMITGTQLSWGIVVGFVVVLVVWYFLFRTPRGYEMRAVGLRATAAEYGGVNIARTQVLALAIAGVLAGLGGASETLGNHRAFVEGFSPGYGWDGIAGGLIARAHPIGAIFAALLMGALRAGGAGVDRAGVAPRDLVEVLQGLVILFVVAPELIRYLSRLWNRRRAHGRAQP